MQWFLHQNVVAKYEYSFKLAVWLFIKNTVYTHFEVLAKSVCLYAGAHKFHKHITLKSVGKLKKFPISYYHNFLLSHSLKHSSSFTGFSLHNQRKSKRKEKMRKKKQFANVILTYFSPTIRVSSPTKYGA